MVTMQDVAARAGVSAKTVSRVFRGEQYVSEAVRQRVTEAMTELSFVPNMLARTFREGRGSLLGIAIPSIVDPFFASVVDAVDSYARDQGYAIAVTSLGSDPAREQSIVEALLRRQISSLIIAPISAEQGYLTAWNVQTPIVVIDREPHGIDTDTFLEDDRGGAALAVRHLFALGHTRVAFLGADDAVATTTQRLDGFRSAHAEAGIRVDEELVILSATAHTGAGLARALNRPRPPTALFSSNSRTSVEIIPTLQQLGRTDLALVSFGDFPMADVLQPSVSVIDQNPGRLGLAAAERALGRVVAPDAAYQRRTVFDVNLVTRSSSTAPPSGPSIGL